MPLINRAFREPLYLLPDCFCVEIRLWSSWICALLGEVLAGEGPWDAFRVQTFIISLFVFAVCKVTAEKQHRTCSGECQAALVCPGGGKHYLKGRRGIKHWANCSLCSKKSIFPHPDPPGGHPTVTTSLPWHGAGASQHHDSVKHRNSSITRVSIEIFLPV